MPVREIAEDPGVNVPPLTVIVPADSVLFAVARVPLDMVSALFAVVVPASVAVPEPAIVSVSYVVAFTVCVLPVNCTVFGLAVAVSVVIVGTVPENVRTAFVPCVSVVTVGFAPENVRPLPLEIVLLIVLIVNEPVPETVCAFVLKV